jgi:serralysin
MYFRSGSGISLLLAETGMANIGFVTVEDGSFQSFNAFTSGLEDLSFGFFEDVDVVLNPSLLFDANPISAEPSGPSYNSIPGNVTTTETMSAGDQVVEVIDFVGDEDWFRVTLVAGQTYDISSLGTGSSPLVDPFVRLLGATGVQQAENDDIDLGNIRNSLLTYTATASGTYYISAQAFADYTGTYTLSFTLGNENSGDLLSNISTTGVAVINGSVGGTFDTITDKDWYAVTLEAGKRYKINVDDTIGDESGDTFLGLYDSNGALILSDDDSGIRDNAAIGYTVTQTGTYFLSAETLNIVGTYALTVKEVPVLVEFSIDEVADFLIEGTHSREAYDISGSTTITYNFDALGPGAQALALQAMQAWADLTPLVFTAASVGTAQIIYTDDLDFVNGHPETGESASNLNSYSGAGVISGSELNVSSNWNGGNTTLDSYTYQTFLHELGHALGLGHGGPYNGGAVYDVDNVYLNDSYAFSVMSYFDQAESGYFGDFRLTLGPQLADVVAIQDLYGANPTTRNGDTVYGFNSTETDIHDFTQLIGPPSLAIYDTGGIDTLDFSGYAQDQNINLNIETHSDVNGIAGVISIARNTVIENAIGGSAVDTITGNSANNVLTGNAGDDILDGGAGTDYAAYNLSSLSDYTIVDNGGGNFTVTANSGTEGSDTLSNIEFLRIGGVDHALGVSPFTEGADNYTGTEGDDILDALGGNDIVNGAGGNDTIYGRLGDDQLDGGAGNDYLDGDNGIDTLLGGDGDDTILTGFKADIVDGGAGNDTVDYSLSDYAHVINLDTNVNVNGHANGDSLTSIENVLGSTTRGDNITGNSGANLLSGQGGNDWLDGGNGIDTLLGGDGDDTILTGFKADIVDGGDGIDTVDYSLSDFAQTINLTSNVNLNGHANGDTLTNIENVLGSDTRKDDITGNLHDNVLDGQGGKDVLRGGKGDDTLKGGVGDDSLFGGKGADVHNGGDGRDWAKYNGSSAFVEVDLINGGTAGIALGDTYINIENVRGTDFDDTILTNNADNKIIAGKGNDIVEGRGGNDVLQGNDGNDSLSGGTGNDTLKGHAGDDTFIYMNGDDVDKILDFDDNGDDQIDLSDFGFASFADVQAIMTQIGSRVSIDFGGGDVLRLENTNLADMGADDFILSGGAAELPNSKTVYISVDPLTDTSGMQQDLIAAFMADNTIQSPVYQTRADGILEIMTDDDFAYDWDGFAAM